MRIAWPRIGAWCVDWLIISVYAAALIPLGLLLYTRSGGLSPAAGNVLGFGVLVAPVTVWMAAREQAARGASPGKRLLRLHVRAADGERLGWPRALIRNGLKIALPWELGHTAAFTLAGGGDSLAANAAGLSCGVAACLIACVYVVSLFTGRTPYDRVAGSEVTTVSALAVAPRRG